jgi:hypothetical protein
VQPRAERGAGAFDGQPQRVPETVEAVFGERVEQCLAVREVAPRSRMTDADSRASSRSESACAPRSPTVRSACSSNAERRLPW